MITPEKSKKSIVIPDVLPLLPVRDVVIFPYMVLPLAVGRSKSIKALEEAMARDRLIFLVTQRKIQTENPGKEDLYSIGVVAEILQLLKMPDGTIKILVEGVERAKITDFIPQQGFIQVRIKRHLETYAPNQELEALMRNVITLFEKYVKLNRRIPIETIMSVSNIDDPSRLADIIASHISIKILQEQLILETWDPKKRLTELAKILTAENDILSIEKKIQVRVRDQIEKTQKEYYLHEQIKAIKKELKETDDYQKEVNALREKVRKSKAPPEVAKQAEKEISRLEKMMPFSPEATVIRTYLDWIIRVPWAISTKDQLDLKRAEKILDEDHYGLDKAKQRIVEYLAVCKLTKKMKGPIICFVGPPGTGKTSLGRSIARALGRKFIRMSLGGIRDEAEIRGHRRTYIGALPGRIIQSLSKIKSRNPVFLLDEVDKMGQDFRGDPAAALLEVLDPEQNNTFSDHYLEVEFDLSDVMFITTANTLYTVPPSLADRMEVIKFPGYTKEEKIKIAQKFLVPKQVKENGLSSDKLVISERALNLIIRDYTLEAGVRNLEREIANVCRKVAKELASEKGGKAVKITAKNLHRYLGIPRYHREKPGQNEVGVATGLAWTEVGGDILSIEVSIMKGKGSLTLTGKLGEVMRESAQAALSYVRSNAGKLGLPPDFYKDKEIHIHIPEGAIPKDGPSAGITMAIALTSALSNRPVKKDVAMTGEITLRGRILSVGGFKEKMLAAHRAGIKTVIFPRENERNLKEIPKEIKNKVKFIPVKNIDEVLRIALVAKGKRKAKITRRKKLGRLPLAQRLPRLQAKEKTEWENKREN
ncbi:Lon protease 1 [subsurface metagenome]